MSFRGCRMDLAGGAGHLFLYTRLVNQFCSISSLALLSAAHFCWRMNCEIRVKIED